METIMQRYKLRQGAMWNNKEGAWVKVADVVALDACTVVRCSCGKTLQSEGQTREPISGVLILTMKPCPDCLDEDYEW